MPVRPRELVRALEKLGWFVDRQVGSHVIMKRGGKPGIIVVPQHPGDLSERVLSKSLKTAGITERQLRELL